MDWQDKALWAVFAISGVAIGSFPFGTETFRVNVTAAAIAVAVTLSFDWLKSRVRHGE